jgi:Peptidase family M1 domain
MAAMTVSLFVALSLLATASGAGQAPPRAIRRTIPITNSFRAGLAAGTRDSTGRPGPHYWQLHLGYQIEAQLDPSSGAVTGHEVVTIPNAGDTALAQIVLRLYQNRFDSRSPRTRVPPSATAGMTITRLVVNGTAFDTARMRDWSDGTLAVVRLPLLPGDTATLEVEWHHEVVLIPPGRRGGARGGRAGTRVFQVTQWYPQVASYDDLRGWDMEPHLGSSEFYNNFASFDVRLQLPAGWLVGATGTLQNPEEVLPPRVRARLSHATESDSQIVIVAEDERGAGRGTLGGDRLTWHFAADSVNDFAWATSADYVWEATRATIPGRGPIPVSLLYLPEHAAYRQTGAMARHALEFYSTLWMPYLFPQFTQADGPEGGMEYPMLTLSGPGFGVTVHEIGHQWWPMMVGTNETWYGWMDEGFNQYMNILSEAAFNHTIPVLDGVGQSFGRYSGIEAQAPMMWDNNYGGPFTSFVTYDKAPMMLSMLGAIVGDSAVQGAMSAYAHDWRLRHPSPWDFMFAMNRELGRDLGWFWYYWLFTTESVDGSIAGVETRGGHTRVTLRQDGEMPAPVVLRVEFAADGPPIKWMKNAVIEGDTATVTWPVDVWFAGSRAFVADLSFGRRKIERITLDPGGRFPDRNPADNSWPR